MIVFLLRHADRAPEPVDDLKQPEGVERAKLLARMLAESGVSIAYCSDAVRAQRTIEPLKQKLGSALTVKTVGTGSPGGLDAHVQKIVAAVKALPADAVAAVVSHSNTVDRIIKRLGGGTIAPIGPEEFDRLFVLFREPPSSVTLVQLRYGAPT